jgi:ATP-dependent Clp protease ATP-binding subunit ClpA
VFERFTEPARQVVVYAQDEARELGHGTIGTEHLLLGLLRADDGLAGRVLASLGVRLEDVRGQVARTVGVEEKRTTGQIPFTARAKKVLELALREARALGHDHIGTEHVLLALVRVEDGVAARTLGAFEAPPDRVREQVLAGLGGPLPAGTAGRRAARPFRRPRRFAYRVLALDSSGELTEELLAPLGAQGWRLVAAVPDGSGLRVVFERPA